MKKNQPTFKLSLESQLIMIIIETKLIIKLFLTNHFQLAVSPIKPPGAFEVFGDWIIRPSIFHFSFKKEKVKTIIFWGRGLKFFLGIYLLRGGGFLSNSFKPYQDLWRSTLWRKTISVQRLARSFGTDRQAAFENEGTILFILWWGSINLPLIYPYKNILLSSCTHCFIMWDVLFGKETAKFFMNIWCAAHNCVRCVFNSDKNLKS